MGCGADIQRGHFCDQGIELTAESIAAANLEMAATAANRIRGERAVLFEMTCVEHIAIGCNQTDPTGTVIGTRS